MANPEEVFPSFDGVLEVGGAEFGVVDCPGEDGVVNALPVIAALGESVLFFLVEDTLVWFGPVLKVAGVGVFALGVVGCPGEDGVVNVLPVIAVLGERVLFFLVEDTLVWFGPVLKVTGVGVFALGDAGVGVALVEVTTSPIAIPLASYLCP
ncbi:MAG: hypothetical protein K940chlam9_01871 [Chlamydiae bacterium]|nr:hypothetical protein [Chlamydiota bacterium]